MTKKSCKKGYKCGGGCISVTYACRKEFPEGISVSIDGARKVIASEAAPRSQYLDQEGDKIAQILRDSGEHRSVSFSPSSDGSGSSELAIEGKTPGKTYYEISMRKGSQSDPWLLVFTVNDEFSADESLPASEKAKVARKLSKGLKTLISNLPEGVAVEVQAHSADGGGEKRKKAYRKAGFLFDDSSTGRGITSGGKIKPATKDELNQVLEDRKLDMKGVRFFSEEKELGEFSMEVVLQLL